jgi:hypothetical protein
MIYGKMNSDGLVKKIYFTTKGTKSAKKEIGYIMFSTSYSS